MEFQNLERPLETVFQSPEGYKIQDVFMTTYTLSRRMLADIILCYAAEMDGCSYTDATDIQKRLFLEKFFKDENNLKEHIRICCQEILPSVTVRKNYGVDCLLNYIEDDSQIVTRIPMNPGSFFHPKLILVKFKCKQAKETEEYRYRLSVSSKNLTYDNYLQAGLVLEGISEQKNANGKQLKSFLENIPGIDRNSTWQELKDTSFSAVLDGDSVTPEFLFTVPAPEKSTLWNRLNKDVCSNNTKYLFLSDSVSADFPKCLQIKDVGMVTMVSNPRSWYSSPKSDKPYCKILKKAGDFRPYLHAKIYAIQQDDRTVIYAGSANCTENALKNNYELMMRFEIQEQIDLNYIQFDENGKIDFMPYAELSADDLSKIKDEGTIQSYFAQMKVSVDINNESICYSFKSKENKPDAIGYMYLCPYNTPYKKELSMALNEGEYTARIMLPFEFIRIPKVQDYVNVMVKEHGLYSVKIESISGQPQTAQAQKDVAAYCAHLYDYLLPSVMDCIPLSSDPDYYQNNDSFDVRLAKFLAAGGDKKDVCTAAEELLKHNFVVQDAEDEENGQFLPDIDNGRFYSQTKWLQKVLKGEN